VFHSLLYNFVSCPATLNLKACLTYLHSEERWSLVTESKHSGVILVQVLTSVCWDPNPPNRDTATYPGSNLVVENKSKSVSAFLFLFGNNRTSVPKPRFLSPPSPPTLQGPGTQRGTRFLVFLVTSGHWFYCVGHIFTASQDSIAWPLLFCCFTQRCWQFVSARVKPKAPTREPG